MILALLLAAGCAHRAPVADVAATDLAAPRAPLEPVVRLALEAAAADLDVGVRRVALHTLVAVEPAPAGGAWALRGRYDPSEYVRRAVVDALARRLAEPESRALLRAIVEDPAADLASRGAAALALAAAVHDGRVPAAEGDAARVTTAAASARGANAAALLLAATALGDPAAAERLRELLVAGNLPLELWLVRALGERPDLGLAPALVTALDTAEPEMRLALAAALLALGDPAGERVLSAALTADEDTALEALDFLADARPPERALAILRGAALAAPLVRDGAAALRFGHGDGDVRDLARALAHEEPEVRLYAARAAARRLSATPPPENADRLRAAVREALPAADPTAELALVAALGGSAAPADRAALTALLADEAARVRVEAAAALAR